MADSDGGLWGLQPRALFSSGSGTFLIEMVLVQSESDESEYIISNVLSNDLVLNYLSFKINGRNILVTRMNRSRDQLAASARLQQDPDP